MAASLLTIIMLTFVHSLAVASWVFMWLHRDWPPLATKMLPLISMIIIFGTIWVMTVLGMMSPRNILGLGCIPYMWLFDAAGAIWVVAWALRFYRLEAIFVHHRALKSNGVKTVLKFVPFFLIGDFMSIPAFLFNGGADTHAFDETTGECTMVRPAIVYPADGSGYEWLQPIFAGCTTWIVAVPYTLQQFFILRSIFRLWRAREQFHEWKGAVMSVVVGSFGFVAFALGLTVEQTAIAYSFQVNFIYWCLMFHPFYHYLKGDKEYLHRFTFGFNNLPTPEQIRGTLEQKLTSPEIRAKLREVAGRRFAVENLDFYEALIVRDEIGEWFERQACTMRILNTWVLPGAKHQVNLPDRIIQDIKQGDVNDPSLFEDARREILRLMNANMGHELDLELKNVLEAADQVHAIKAVTKRSGPDEALSGSAEASEQRRNSNSAQNANDRRQSKRTNNRDWRRRLSVTASIKAAKVAPAPSPASGSMDPDDQARVNFGKSPGPVESGRAMGLPKFSSGAIYTLQNSSKARSVMDKSEPPDQ